MTVDERGDALGSGERGDAADTELHAPAADVIAADTSGPDPDTLVLPEPGVIRNGVPQADCTDEDGGLARTDDDGGLARSGVLHADCVVVGGLARTDDDGSAHRDRQMPYPVRRRSGLETKGT